MGRAAPCKPLLRGRRLLPAPRKDRGKQGRGEGPEAAVGKGKGGWGSPPGRGQLEGAGFVCFALLRSAFRWLLPPGRVCCAPGAQTPKRKRKRKEGAQRAPRLWETAAVASGPARLGLWGPGAGLGSPHGERLGAGVAVVAGPPGAAVGTLPAHSPFAVPRLREAAAGPKPQPGTAPGGFRVCFGSQAHGTEPTGLAPVVFFLPFFALFRPPLARKNHQMV